ncbi:tripartite tricarboxylate transporter TctB family protein [Bosea caraganae]|uniref:Tripartite tricarboxylate transporter TctB family protein n=1 Tax=Bosea caraganae TaxID=2763117 RepID=A0A370L9Z8_9HYPH|nr:tripartite tricarboxylate transporter TctB family protein [Bosea caraganae]RDJ21832.1 tripartite tricarboxylate transporter TctB family protein [Bosea caraganae]RDJ28137.1 tripartite tricarboxylate transporter TctB family protein [Bosea caraganae]
MREQAALKDLAGGIAVLAIAGAYYWAIGDIADSTLSDDVGATGLPRILAYVLAGFGLILTARAVMAGALSPAAGPAPSAPAPAEDDDHVSPVPRALGFLAFGVAYVVLVPIIGYLPSIALLIGSVALYEGAPRNWKTLVIAIGGATAFWGIFVKILGVHQPSGWFF